jgi:hypothetical protein
VIEARLLLDRVDLKTIIFIIILESPMTIKYFVQSSFARSIPCLKAYDSALLLVVFLRPQENDISIFPSGFVKSPPHLPLLDFLWMLHQIIECRISKEVSISRILVRPFATAKF